MKQFFAVLLVSSTQALAASSYVPGEVIVKYKDGAVRTRAVMNSLYDSVGVESVSRLGKMHRDVERLSLAEGGSVADAIAQLQTYPEVEYAQPNFILTLPSDEPVLSKILASRTQDDGALPCIPGFDIPGCDPNASLPCLFPGVPFPPGCTDDGSSPTPGPGPGPAPTGRPDVKPEPSEINPPVADPSLAKAYGIDRIGAVKAWAEHKGDKKLVVAVIDTGIDYNHEDLSFNLWRNASPTQNDVVGFDFVHKDGLPFDDNKHGSHCAGTIGAVGGNGVGVSGVNQRVSVMGLKFIGSNGSGTTADAVAAIDYAINHGAKVLSASWGGPADDENKVLYDAIERVKAKGALFVAAAGNDGKNNDNSSEASYPAAFDNENLIAVAATDSSDKLAFFSNYGKKTTHLAAPGVNVYSTTPGNRYEQLSGTSMAAPHVAGAAAFVWSKHPDWDFRKVKAALLKSVAPVAALEGKTVTGGRLDVFKALHSTE